MKLYATGAGGGQQRPPDGLATQKPSKKPAAPTKPANKTK